MGHQLDYLSVFLTPGFATSSPVYILDNIENVEHETFFQIYATLFKFDVCSRSRTSSGLGVWSHFCLMSVCSCWKVNLCSSQLLDWTHVKPCCRNSRRGFYCPAEIDPLQGSVSLQHSPSNGF